MMRKVLACVTAVLLFGALCVGCGETEHTHDWTGVVTTEATCTEEGVMTYTCSGCDETYTETIDALGHTWGEWETTQELNCTDSDGVATRTCTVCGETETETTTKSGSHSYVVSETTGDCVTETVYTYTCSVCGDSYTVTGDVVPDNHVGTVYDCGSHCAFCDSGEDHSANSCGISGHYNCDDLHHEECSISAADNMAFTEVDGGLQLEKFTAADDGTEVFIPAYVDGTPVVSIADEVFAYNTGSITQADGVDDWLASVTYIFVPDTVETVGTYFCWYMTSLETLRMPEELDSIGYTPFFNAPALTSLKIPQGITSFSGNTGNCLSSDSYALEELTIPSSFTDLDTIRFMFLNSSVSVINYQGTADEWSDLVSAMTYSDYQSVVEAVSTVNCGYDYETACTDEIADMQVRYTGYEYTAVDGGYELTKLSGNLIGDTLTIPAEILGEPVVSLGDAVLCGNTAFGDSNADLLNDIKYIEFEGDNLTTIGNYNFYDMESLVEVILPDNVTYIGLQSFAMCDVLETIDIPDGATVNMGGIPFYDLPALTTLNLSADIMNLDANSGYTFYNTPSDLSITFEGSSRLWNNSISLTYLSENATVTYLGGRDVVQDGNGSEYVLSDDETYYTLVGFYDTVQYDGTDVTGYTVQETFNELPVKGIGDSVFNAEWYEDDEINTWIASLSAVVTTDPEDTNWEVIGNYNFVGLSSLSQLRLPATITSTTLRGCFVDVAANVIRIPRGVVTLDSCLQWSDTITVAYLGIPSTLKEFTGECFTYGTAVAFFVFVDITEDFWSGTTYAIDFWDALVEASSCSQSNWEATQTWLLTFSDAGLVQGNENQYIVCYELYASGEYGTTYDAFAAYYWFDYNGLITYGW